MKKLAIILLVLSIGVLDAISQQAYDIDISGNEGLSRAEEMYRRADYQRLVKKVLQEDELFVLFYIDVALVIDPTLESQVVEPISTDNPWSSLERFLPGKTNIYFCPSGSQLGKAIEYMDCPLDTTILMSDRFGMYRLSSPKELFNNRGDDFKSKKHKAVVFGGLSYDEETEEEPPSLAFRGGRGSLAHYKNLRWTLDEALYIDSLFKKHHIETALLTGPKGTEANFHQIPHQQVDILHVASHGFYEPFSDNQEAQTLPDWMLSHSWLLLSGAEHRHSQKEHNGRLTAYEISKTDLTGVNLVVLSACETGLGDVKDNDVFGLIKGFKKAGAGTLLVSLSAVSDTVTSLLITRFYDNLFRGDNPRRALENAQRYIRLRSHGQFNDPKYWATFVLVDDLHRNVAAGITPEERKAFLETIVCEQDIYTENFIFPDWERVRQRLHSDDAVIQICTYKDEESTKYVAMVGDVDTGRCKIVRLPSPEEIQFRFNDESMERLDSILWSRLLPHALHAHRIFIQPSGSFHDLPLEYTPEVWEKYDVRRISSLSALLDDYPSSAGIYSIALFGGLDYDAAEEARPVYGSFTGAIGYFKELTATKTETDDIAQLFSSHNQPKALFQGKIGTERAFMELPTYSPPLDIIHLATHSGALPENFLTSKFQKEHHSIADHFLGRCFVALSGANEALLVSNGTYDGLLLGSEIKVLDLKQVNLVVIGSNSSKSTTDATLDVPWNLNNSFKKAGVKTILGAINSSIGDEATLILMKEFYKQLLSGRTKHQSLLSAIHHLRTTEEMKYDQPLFWASFVLIDALE